MSKQPRRDPRKSDDASALSLMPVWGTDRAALMRTWRGRLFVTLMDAMYADHADPAAVARLLRGYAERFDVFTATRLARVQEARVQEPVDH